MGAVQSNVALTTTVTLNIQQVPACVFAFMQFSEVISRRPAVREPLVDPNIDVSVLAKDTAAVKVWVLDEMDLEDGTLFAEIKPAI